MLNKLKETFLDILFPKFCVNCKEEKRYLCEKCTLFISETALICPSCMKPEFFGKTHKNCLKKEGLDGLVSFWDYEGVVKDLIRKTKEESLIDIPKELINYGFLVIGENKKRFFKFTSFLFDEKTVISYIPIHKKKENVRGFDQSEVIAKHLARITKKEKVCLLKREIETKSQMNLNKKERFLNVENAFSLISLKKAEQVVLVNDVWTSGATMKECTRVLKEGGVKKIWGFTLSKTS